MVGLVAALFDTFRGKSASYIKKRLPSVDIQKNRSTLSRTAQVFFTICLVIGAFLKLGTRDALTMRVCLFDIDGTLIRSGGAGSRAMKRAFEDVFRVECDLSGVSFSGRTDFGITRDLFANAGVEHSRANLSRFFEAYLPALSTELSQGDGQVCVGVEGWLTKLAKHPDCAVGLLTGNMRAAAEIKLRHFGLWQHFHFGGYGDHVPHRHEVARSAIQAAMEFAGQVDHDQIWTIGDTPDDISAARAHGIRVVAVATGSHSFEELQMHRPDVLAHNLEATQLVSVQGIRERGKNGE